MNLFFFCSIDLFGDKSICQNTKYNLITTITNLEVLSLDFLINRIDFVLHLLYLLYFSMIRQNFMTKICGLGL